MYSRLLKSTLFMTIVLLAAIVNGGFWSNIDEPQDKLPQYVTHRIFFDIEVEGEPWGRIEIGLFGKLAPKAAENMAQLADGTAGIGKNGKKLHYKGSHFHRIIPGMLA